MDNTRSSAKYKAWVKQVMAKCEPTCIRCGYPVDMALPRTDDWGASADHEPPLAETGEIAPSLDASGIAHLKCNRSHGGRLGSQRATNKRAKPQTRFSRHTTSTPAAPVLYPPEGAGKAKSAPVAPVFHGDGFVMPRIETRAPACVRGSHGESAATWLRDVYGMELRGWQRYALERALEHDEDGALVWPMVILTVGRQSGKSWLSRAVCMWRLHHAHLFGETQTILHVANKRDTAMEVLRPAGLWAVEKYGKSATKWGNTAAGITLPSGDRWLIHAANDSAGVGYSVSMVFLDEAWKIQLSVLDSALQPTMAERAQAQAWLVSTAGDSTSELMITYRSTAINNLEPTEAGGILILEWSSPPEADPEDVETWMWASPEWTPKREAFVRQQFGRIEESSFRREWCNQWVTRSGHWLKDSWWADTTSAVELPHDTTWTVACESAFDGMGHAVAIAGVLEDGRLVVRATTHRTIREVDERLAEIRAGHPQLHVIVTPGYVDRLREHFDDLVGQREAVAGTQNLIDLFDRRAILHDGSTMLHEHFANSTIAKRQAGWVLSSSMGAGGSYAARAVMFAAAQATKTPRPLAVIHSRRRA